MSLTDCGANTKVRAEIGLQVAPDCSPASALAASARAMISGCMARSREACDGYPRLEAAHRANDDWWQALGWVRDGLNAGSMLREVEVKAGMPLPKPWTRVGALG